MKKYLLVQEKLNGDLETIDSSFSKATIKNKQELQEKIYKRHLKIIVMER